MTSNWLARDAEPSQRLKNDRKKHAPKCSSGGPVFLGVFNDDPANIGAWLPRPKTPFAPARTAAFGFRHPDDLAEEVIGESPPAELTFDFSQPVMAGSGDVTLSIF
jgi:hypothetical protein